MLFYRSENAEAALQSFGIVVGNVFFNHLHKTLAVSKPFAIIPFPFKNTPEALHRTVVNTMSHSGHALRHTRLFQFCMKCTVCILKPSITVKQRMCIRIGSHSRIKGVVYQRVVVAVSNHVGDYSSVVQVKNGAKIDLVYFCFLVPFELCYIRQPLLVWFVGMKRPIEEILCYILRISCVSRTPIIGVFYGGLDIFGAANPQHPLITDADTMITFQIISDPTVTFIRTFSVDSLGDLSNSVVFLLSARFFPRKPAIISISGYV